MSEWIDSQRKLNNTFLQLLHERNEKANPRRILGAEETKRLNKLGAIAKKLQRGESRPLRHLKKRMKDLLILFFMEQVKLNNNSQSNI